jgi:hypothetical protein
MEQSLAGRGAAARGARPGAGGVVLVLLAAVAIGAVVLLALRGRAPGRDAGAAAESAPAGPSLASRAARDAAGRPAGSPAAVDPDGPRRLDPDVDAEAESRRRFEERRAQLAATRPSARDAGAGRRAADRERAQSWWRRHGGSFDALDGAAARVVDPATTRIDVACGEYVRTFDELLGTDVRPAPTDGLATAVQRYFFFHSNAVASCRANRFRDAENQLATWAGAARSLESAVAEALAP